MSNLFGHQPPLEPSLPTQHRQQYPQHASYYDPNLSSVACYSPTHHFVTSKYDDDPRRSSAGESAHHPSDASSAEAAASSCLPTASHPSVQVQSNATTNRRIRGDVLNANIAAVRVDDCDQRPASTTISSSISTVAARPYEALFECLLSASAHVADDASQAAAAGEAATTSTATTVVGDSSADLQLSTIEEAELLYGMYDSAFRYDDYDATDEADTTANAAAGCDADGVDERLAASRRRHAEDEAAEMLTTLLDHRPTSTRKNGDRDEDGGMQQQQQQQREQRSMLAEMSNMMPLQQLLAAVDDVTARDQQHSMTHAAATHPAIDYMLDGRSSMTIEAAYVDNMGFLDDGRLHVNPADRENPMNEMQSPVSNVDDEEDVIIADSNVLSRALASLPTSHLFFAQSPDQTHEYSVYTAQPIAARTKFGPVEGDLRILLSVEMELMKSDGYRRLPALFVNDHQLLDVSNEHTSNWMRYVRLAYSYSEQNVLLHESADGRLFFRTCRPIAAQHELKVGYSPDYAQRYQLPILQPIVRTPSIASPFQLPSHALELSFELPAIEADRSDSPEPVPMAALHKPSGHTICDTWTCLECQQHYTTYSQLQQHLQDVCHVTLIDRITALPAIEAGRSDSPEPIPLATLLKPPGHTICDTWTCRECQLHYNTYSQLQQHLQDVCHVTLFDRITALQSSSSALLMTPPAECSPPPQEHQHQQLGQPARQSVFAKYTAMLDNADNVQDNVDDAIKYNAFDEDEDEDAQLVDKAKEEDEDEDRNRNLIAETDGQHRTSVELKCIPCELHFVNSNDFNQHQMQRHSAARYQCPYCSFKTRKPLFLERHQTDNHSNTAAQDAAPLHPRFTCLYCHLKLSGATELSAHVGSHLEPTGGGSAFECPRDNCSARFPRYAALRKHVTAVHAEPTHACPDCGQRFKGAHRLRQHQRMHELVGRFECAEPECARRFHRRDKMLAHWRLRHEVGSVVVVQPPGSVKEGEEEVSPFKGDQGTRPIDHVEPVEPTSDAVAMQLSSAATVEPPATPRRRNKRKPTTTPKRIVTAAARVGDGHQSRPEAAAAAYVSEVTAGKEYRLPLTASGVVIYDSRNDTNVTSQAEELCCTEPSLDGSCCANSPDTLVRTEVKRRRKSSRWDQIDAPTALCDIVQLDVGADEFYEQNRGNSPDTLVQAEGSAKKKRKSSSLDKPMIDAPTALCDIVQLDVGEDEFYEQNRGNSPDTLVQAEGSAKKRRKSSPWYQPMIDAPPTVPCDIVQLDVEVNEIYEQHRLSTVDPYSSNNTDQRTNIAVEYAPMEVEQSLVAEHQHHDAVEEETKTAEEGNWYTCNLCGIACNRIGFLAVHMTRCHPEDSLAKDHQPPAAEHDIAEPKKARTTTTNEGNFTNTYTCNLCGVGFKRRGILVNHLTRCHPEISLAGVHELQQPIERLKHRYLCPYCEKSYGSYTKRRLHVAAKHPGSEQPVRLLFGQPVAAAPAALASDEMESGTEELDKSLEEPAGVVSVQVHSCDRCPKQYVSRARLLRHMRSGHGDDEESGGEAGVFGASKRLRLAVTGGDGFVGFV